MLIRGADQTPYGVLLLRAIRNKIQGKANEALTLSGARLEWDNIKNNLRKIYAPKKSVAMLIREIQTVPQESTVGQLYFGIARLREQLQSLSVINDPTQVNNSNQLYDEICLNAFLVGLKEPLRSTVRAHRPMSLEKAYQICRAEQAFLSQCNIRHTSIHRPDQNRSFPRYFNPHYQGSRDNNY